MRWICAALVWLGMWNGAAALASKGHEFRSSISEGPVGTRLLGPESLAVDHATGQVFVGDGNGYVEVFSATGEYQTRFGEGTLEPMGIAVDEANGDVYVAEPVGLAVLTYEPDGEGGYRLLSTWVGHGTPAKEFGEVVGVAFDNAKSASDPAGGDLYVVQSESAESGGFGAVDLFKPPPNPAHPDEVAEGAGEEGAFLGRLSGPKLQEPNGVAVDSSTGRVLVADSAVGAIDAYSDTGTFEEKLTGKGSPQGNFEGPEEEAGNVAGLAVDEASGEIYVAEAERHHVSQYSANGQWQGWITAGKGGPLGEPRAAALSSGGDVYVADSGLALVDVFGPNVVIPDTETGKISKEAVTRTSALLTGTVNGEGLAAKYRFEWGTSEAYGQSTPELSVGEGEQTVTFTLEGLHAGTTYHFRIVAENENGAAFGQDREFTTLPAVEGVKTGAARGVEAEAGTITGSLKPGGSDAHYYFQWGTTSFYGKTSPAPPGIDAGSGEKLVAAEAKLSGLAPNRTYHYRLVAENALGTTYGADQEFKTLGPPQISNEPTTGIGHEEATIHAKINPEQLATSYHFEYGENTSYGSEVPVGGGTIPAGSTPTAVSATIGKLKLGVTYHFRVVASNSAGATSGRDQVFMTVASARVDASYASNVTATAARISAQIDPLGRDTDLYFQYGTASCRQAAASCSDTPSRPGEDIGAGESDVARSVTLNELKPDTTYYYRVLASNSLGESEGPEHTFTTKSEEAPVSLPDGRAWEMVSPVDKHGAPIEGLTREGGVVLAAEDGNSLTYVAYGAMTGEPEGNRSPEQQQIISTRTSGGWSSQDIATPNNNPQGVDPGRPPEYELFTPDLSSAIVDPFALGVLAEPQLSPEARQRTPYLRDNQTGTYRPLVTEANVAPGTEFGARLHFVAATPDLSHVIISSKVPLTGSPAGSGLYEWTGGKLQFVSTLPTGTPAENDELGYYSSAAHTISNDGTRVIWTNFDENSRRGHLYMSDTATGQTLQLDAAQGGAPEPEEGSAQFQTATSDGSRVFFTDKQPLTPESTAAPEGAQTAGKPDLYECEIGEPADGQLVCNLRDLTVEENEGEHAAVQGFLLGAGEGGESMYLVAQGVLADNENGNGEVAQPGMDNLYALHEEGGEWNRTFVATLSSEDKPEWEGEIPGDSAFLTARASPNGRYLAFMSAAPITGYENIDRTSGKRDEEVYLYDSASAGLRCVSCNPTGARPAGVFDTQVSGEGLGLVVDRRLAWAGHWLAGNIPGWTAESLTTALFQSRYLSNEGRLYFNSPDDLVPQATNEKEDVYEYEPSGVGSCQSATGGCIALISGGSSERESAFLEATPSGDDVFFLTQEQLLPQDTDTAFDVYDARGCTEASPCLSPPKGAPVSCNGTEACRPAQPAQQIAGGPTATASVPSVGNGGSRPAPSKQGKATKAAPKPLSSAQKLSKALAACRKRYPHSKTRRHACEAQARSRYARHKAKRSVKAGKSSSERARRRPR